VSGFDDYQDMRAQIDELLVTGEPVPGNEELAAFVAALRRAAEAPAPAPTPALSVILRDGLAPASSRTLVDVGEHWSLRPRVRRLARYVAGLSLAAKIVLGAGVAVAAVTGAAGIAPGAGQPGPMQPAPISPKIPPIPPIPVSPMIPPAPVSPMKQPSPAVPPASGSPMGSLGLANPRP
jgi:hypothetical protein